MPEVEPAVEEEQESDNQREDKKSVSHGQRHKSGDDQKTAGEQENSAQEHLLDVLEEF